MAPSDFDRFVNPISTRWGGGDIMPTRLLLPPLMFLDLPTALHWEECMNLLRWPGTHILSTLATAHLRPFKLLTSDKKKYLLPFISRSADSSKLLILREGHKI